MADKVGRRPLIMLGIALLGLGYAFYPFADSILMMYAYRLVFAIGVATVATTITIVNTDYVQDRSRGGWVAVASFVQGTGIFIISQILRKLPQSLAGQGMSEVEIAKILFWGCTAVCVLVFIIAGLGLSRKKPEEARDKDSIVKLIGAGIQAARDNSRIALGYFCAFAARGDVIVVGTFTFSVDAAGGAGSRLWYWRRLCPRRHGRWGYPIHGAGLVANTGLFPRQN